MTEYAVTLQRSLTITDGECRRRLSAVYRIILQCARHARHSADGETVSRESPASAGPTARTGGAGGVQPGMKELRCLTVSSSQPPSTLLRTRKN